MKRYGSLRWILLAAGVVAILGLTGMNVYSLYALQENTLESARENKKLQIAEFADKIRYRFYKKFHGLGSADLQRVEEHFQQTGQFTEEVRKLINKSVDDPIYDGIYFFPSNSDACQGQQPIFQYTQEKGLVSIEEYSEIICDGMGIARTQMKSLLDEYRYNNKIFFDSHRSLTIVLINQEERSVFGYLVMPFNQQYLRNSFLPRVLAERFGPPEKSGMNVWLRDWSNKEIVASSNASAVYDPRKIQFEQDFPNFFDFWELEVSLTDQSAVAASNSSLYMNIAVLAAAMFLLLGALVFMFISAQKERALAERQADFLANVTHELKTPLSVMQAAGENLADGRVKDQSRLESYGAHIFNEAVRLRKMIEKLLDVAKANAGKSLIDPKPANISKLVRSYLDEHREFIESKGFTIETDIAENVPTVKVDTDSFETILSNLVENAVKYSDDEKYLGITLKSNEEHVSLRIEDRGIGMSKKNISNIFNKFFRAEDTLTAQTKGHGLGLSIVKNLVDLNEGEIEVRSEPGQGSVFIVSFPIAEPSEESSLNVNISSSIRETESSIEEPEQHVS